MPAAALVGQHTVRYAWRPNVCEDARTYSLARSHARTHARTHTHTHTHMHTHTHTHTHTHEHTHAAERMRRTIARTRLRRASTPKWAPSAWPSHKMRSRPRWPCACGVREATERGQESSDACARNRTRSPNLTPGTKIHTRTHTHTHTCMHACMHACIHTYIHVYLYTHASSGGVRRGGCSVCPTRTRVLCRC